MSAKLIVVVGLPGSGKTTYMQALKDDGEITEFFDDFQAEAYSKEKDPRLSRWYGPLLAALKQNKTVAVSDIRYCVTAELHVFLAAVLDVVPETKLDVRYFENNPEACEQNIKARARKERIELELQFVREHAPEYEISKATVLKVRTERES